MTKNEAIERATAIWHNVPYRVWSPEINGEWYISLQKGMQEPIHHLDNNGHADCHPECTMLELQLPNTPAPRGKLVYKSIYIDEKFASAFHDAVCELMNAHPEWLRSDIDVDWEEVKEDDGE